jgi:outer membrane receptor protein involved in Fe transport
MKKTLAPRLTAALLVLSSGKAAEASPAAGEGPDSGAAPEVWLADALPEAPPAAAPVETETPPEGAPPAASPPEQAPPAAAPPEAALAPTSGADIAADSAGLESLSLEDLLEVQVRGASFFVLPTEKLPNTSYKLETKSFLRLPVRSLGELLDAAVPGLFVGNDRFFGPVIAQRGAVTDCNAKTVVMLDGQNLNQRLDYGYNMALALPLLGDIEAVEVIQGPGAILYGSGSISGFVNMLPKTGKSHPGFELSSELGVFDVATTAEASYGTSYGQNNSNDLFIYAGLARSSGFVPAEHAWNQYRGIDMSTNLQGGVQPSGKVTLNWHEGRLRVKGQFVDMWSTQAAGVSGTQPTGWHEAYLALRPEYVLALAPKHELGLIGSVMLHESGFSARDERKLLPALPTASTAMGDMQKRLPYTGRESNYAARLVYKLEAFSGHKIAAGAEVGTREFAGNKAWFYAVPRDLAFDSVSRWNEYSVFAEDVLSLKALLAVVGLRYDLVDFRGGYFVARDRYDVIPKGHVSQISPRLSLAYEFADGLSARIAYQRGFRAANANDLQENRRLAGPNNQYWTPAGQFGGPTWAAPPAVVVPEMVDSLDLNLHGRKTYERWSLIGDVNGYYDLFQHYIVYDLGQRNAASRFASVGCEIVAKLQTQRGDSAQLSYAYSRPVGLDAVTAQEIQLTDAGRSSWRLYYPHQIKLTGVLMVPGFDRRLSLGATARYYSALPAWSSSEALAATADSTWDESSRRQSLVAVSASVVLDVTPRLQLRLVAINAYHNGTPVVNSYAGHPELTAVGLDQRLIYLTLVAKVD